MRGCSPMRRCARSSSPHAPASVACRHPILADGVREIRPAREPDRKPRVDDCLHHLHRNRRRFLVAALAVIPDDPLCAFTRSSALRSATRLVGSPSANSRPSLKTAIFRITGTGAGGFVDSDSFRHPTASSKDTLSAAAKNERSGCIGFILRPRSAPLRWSPVLRPPSPIER